MADQLDLVKNLPLTPDFIINIKVKTECTFNNKILIFDLDSVIARS